MFTLFKYLVWLVVSLLCLMFATITISEFLVDSAIDAPYDEKLGDFTTVLAHELRTGDGGLEIRPGVVQLLHTDRRDRLYFAVRDRDGNVVAGDRELGALVATASTTPSIAPGIVNEEPVRVATLSIQDPRHPDAMLTIQVAETTNRRAALVEALRTQAVALPQLLVLVVGLLLIVFGYAFVWRPMQQLRELIDHRGSDDLSPLDPQAAPHDLRPLILSINGLMERLSASVRAQRRFIADAAHQLRTPLAGIQSQTERALVERDPAAVRVALERLAAGTEHATQLANRLLMLARAGTTVATRQADVDLFRIVRDTIAEHLPQALARRQDLGFAGVPGEGRCMVRGDALLLREMLSNIVDNALRYSPEGSAITVSIETHADAWLLAVGDNGPGIPADERERVFEPFYRGADVVAPGTGLGLAIVRTIAEAHGASVSLAPASPKGGLRVTVRLPGARPTAA
jgi:two-component system sensor histidine kinase TctE